MANIKISELPQLIFSSITNNDVIPIVDVNSNTTSKVLIGDLKSYFETTFTGGTVSGNTIFQNGLTANTISATTYENLPIDVFVTGGTYSAETITFTNNVGSTFIVSGISNNEWIETTVSFSPAQLLTMGTPLEILPAPGVDKYYEYEITMFNTNAGTIRMADTTPLWIGSNGIGTYIPHQFSPSIKKIFRISSKNQINFLDTVNEVATAWGINDNEAVQFGTLTYSNPTQATAEITFEVKYKVLLF
jgi:hypothetical protein